MERLLRVATVATVFNLLSRDPQHTGQGVEAEEADRTEQEV
jgi:hypothetical protein